MKKAGSLWVLACTVLMSGLDPAQAAEPTLSGPVIGGAHDRPFTASLADLAAAGYVEQEYFIQGTASAYRSNAPLASDGRWSVGPSRSAPFKTRLLIRRPKDPTKFNGTVVVEWLNVSGGFDVDAEWGYAYPGGLQIPQSTVAASAMPTFQPGNRCKNPLTAPAQVSRITLVDILS